MLSGELFWKRCERCDARHYLSYAVSGYHIPSGQVLPYPGWESAEWTHVTEHTVWQTTLLTRYRQQLLHSHTAADAYMREYTGIYSAEISPTTRKYLSHVWLSWELVAWLQELGEAATPIEIGSIAGLDATLLRLTPRLLDLFTRFWGVGHKQLCPQGAETCVCYILDGHMKCRRLVCANKHARLVDQGTLGTAVLGCTHTPLRTRRERVGFPSRARQRVSRSVRTRISSEGGEWARGSSRRTWSGRPWRLPRRRRPPRHVTAS